MIYIFFLILRYMGDFYELELQSVSGVRGWSIPETKGGGPSARESHTAVANTGLGSPKLYIFGGMKGCRLNDLWQLDLGSRNVINKHQELSDVDPTNTFFCLFVFRHYGLVNSSNSRLASDFQKSSLCHCRRKQVRHFCQGGSSPQVVRVCSWRHLCLQDVRVRWLDSRSRIRERQ